MDAEEKDLVRDAAAILMLTYRYAKSKNCDAAAMGGALLLAACSLLSSMFGDDHEQIEELYATVGELTEALRKLREKGELPNGLG
jgi:hypothetical protein